MSDFRYILNCAYPIVDIQNILNINKNLDTVHLYVDLKNSFTGLYVPDIVQEIVESSKELKNKTNSSIFQSIVFTAANWKYWAKQKKIKIKIFFFNDHGKSSYHRIINENYKNNRKITNSTLLNYSEEMNIIRDKNFDLSEKILNKFQDIYYLKTNFLESDFLSYYYITRYCKNLNNVLHIIASNDKDHYQTLFLDNTIQYSKKKKIIKLLNKTNVLEEFLKINKYEVIKQNNILNKLKNIDPYNILYIMSFCGDKIDNISGINGIGPIKATEMFMDTDIVNKLIGKPDDAITRVINNNNLLIENIIPINILPKNWKIALLNNLTITNSFKQISYEVLSQWLDKRDSDNKISNYNDIYKIFNKETNKLSKNSFESFLKMLNNLEDLQLEKDDVYILSE